MPTPNDSRLRVHLSGNYLILATDFGLQVRFDGNQYVDISLPSTFKNHLCGLCGKSYDCVKVISFKDLQDPVYMMTHILNNHCNVI